jgi:predicted transcriptional regulator
MPCGRASGIVALDLDTKSGEDGPGEFAKLVSDRGEEPPRTRTVRTPSGGTHLLFTCSDPIPSNKGKLGPGIEVKADGTYILVAPSPGYVIEDSAPPAPLPEWIADLARGPKTPQSLHRGRKPTSPSGEPIQTGERNLTLFFRALEIKDSGGDRREVLDGLREENRNRCRTPLEEAEVERIANSASRYPIRGARTPPEVIEALKSLDNLWWGREWRGVGGATEASVVRALMRLTERFGIMAADGPAAWISVRDLALMVGACRKTIENTVGRLAEAGVLRRVAPAKRGLSGGFALLTAPRLRHPRTGLEEAARGVVGAARASVASLQTPHFRWRGLVGKSRERTLCVLEAWGPQSAEEIADRLGLSRPRDARRRLLKPLVELGLVEDRGGLYALPEDFRSRAEEVRRIPYAVVLERVGSHVEEDTGRTVHYVVADSPQSEVQRETRDRAMYAAERDAFRLRLQQWKAEAEAACQPGRVIVEANGYLVDAETGEVRGYAVRSGWNDDETPDELVAS